MKIELDVSEKNEATATPWWMIMDPKQMMKPDYYTLNSMITGPFFSREEANEVLEARRHHYSKNAVVFCASGCYTSMYDKAYRDAERKAK